MLVWVCCDVVRGKDRWDYEWTYGLNKEVVPPVSWSVSVNLVQDKLLTSVCSQVIEQGTVQLVESEIMPFKLKIVQQLKSHSIY